MNDILEQLEINQTFFVQFAIFVGFFIGFSQLYVKPIQRLLEKRNHKLKDDVHSSSELLKTIEARVADFESAIAKTRAEAIKSHEQAISEVRVKEEAQIAQLKDELKKDYLKAVAEIQDEKLKVESELKLQLSQVSDSVVQKILVGS